MGSAPTPPDPPNPYKTAAAQSGMNTDTAIAQMMANHTGQITPWGSLTYDKTGSDSFVNSQGKTVTMPTYTATQTLTPQQQAILSQEMGAQLGMATVGNQEINRIGGILGQGVSFAGAPNVPQIDWSAPTGGPISGTFGSGGSIANGFSGGGPIQGQVGMKDATQARNDVTSALLARMQPQVQQQTKSMQASLAAQGIAPGSEAYNNAMRQLGTQQNDLTLGAYSQGADEANQVFQQKLAQGQFANAAQGQQFGQNAAQAAFGNQAEQQQYTQNLGRASFGNAAQAQRFGEAQQGFQDKGALYNLGTAARQNWINEYLTQRQTPINEITALLSGSQVQQPHFLNMPTTPVANTDFAQIQQNTFQDKMGIYNAQMQQNNAMMGGLFGLGGTLLSGMMF